MLRKTRLALTLSLVLIASAQSQNANAQRSFTEDFSSKTYEDAGNTTADWNTSLNQLRLPAFIPHIAGNDANSTDAWEIIVRGDLAFVADGVNGMRILDISNPTSPVQLGVYDTPVSVHDVTVDGVNAYLSDGPTGMLVLDVSIPTNPTLKATYNSPGAVRDVVIEGRYAIIADDTAGIRIVDMDNFSAPVEIGFVDPPGTARGIEVQGDYAYVANGADGLRVIDITDLTNPLDVGHLAVVGNAIDVAVDGNHAFLADGGGGFWIIDVSDPTAPSAVANQVTLANSFGIAVDGDYAYLADGTGGLRLFDITNLADPLPLGTLPTPGSAYGLAVEGEHVFVADLNGGVQIVQTRMSAIPSWISQESAAGSPERAAVSGNHLFVAAGSAGLQVFDITLPSAPGLVGSIVLGGTARGVAISGDVAYIANGFQSFRVVDISDPTLPVEIGSATTIGAAQDVVVSGDHAYVADGAGGLRVFDVSDPTTPVAVGVYDSPGHGRAVALPGGFGTTNFLYLADDTAGLRVVDISNPATPHSSTVVDTPGNAADIAISGRYAFVADGSGGLRVMDTYLHHSPIEVGFSTGLLSGANRVIVVGDRALVSRDAAGMVSVDISDPLSPAATSVYQNGAGSLGLVSLGDYAYLIDPSGSVHCYQVFQRSRETTLNQAQSLNVVALGDPILKVRLDATYQGSMAWNVSADGGVSWTPVTQMMMQQSQWIGLSPPFSFDLRWSTSMTWIISEPWADDVTIEWLIDGPVINTVTDIPNDQGRQVRVEWARSGHDFIGDAEQIVEYAVYRQIEPGLSPALSRAHPADDLLTESLSPSVREHAMLMQQADWDFVTTVPVRAEDYYAVVVPTLADSTITSGQHLSTFRVSALTATPALFFDSTPVAGYSVDNLAPGPPANIVAAYAADGVQLDWDDAPETDFRFFRVYRGTTPEFVLSEQSLVRETAVSAWADQTAGPWGYHYKFTAVDQAGNESEIGEPVIITGAPSQVPAYRHALHGASPNPFNPSTVLRLTVPGPRAIHVRLEIFDSVGRLVMSLVDEPRTPGEHDVVWRGTNSDGIRVGSGVYFARFSADGHPPLTTKMTLVK